MTKLYIFLAFFCWSISLSAQLTIHITSVPASTPLEDDIYIAGNFNAWDAGNSAYILNNNQNGTFSITFSPEPGELLFKFTRGAWQTVEGTANGAFVPDRSLLYEGGQMSVDLSIAGWEDLGSGGGSASTAADNVHVLDDNFYIPQLNRSRRVWIYLPPDYEYSDKDYPVLYMHDAQNLFDATTSFAGEWELDETLNELHAQGDYGCIVVGIENGGAQRLNEYSPWYNAQYDAGGEGDEYVDFIVSDLKPYVDANYRTLPEREYTGIGGSSMGGLISHYAGLKYQDVFGKIAAFSCSFWFAEQSYEQVAAQGKQADMKVYYLVGEGEGSSMVDDTESMHALMLQNDFEEAELFKDIDADGQHSEWYWRREFAVAYQWLFGGLNLTGITPSENMKIRVYPNPTRGHLVIENSQFMKKGNIAIYDLNGHLVQLEKLRNKLNVSKLPVGVYVLKIESEGRFVFSDKIVVE